MVAAPIPLQRMDGTFVGWGGWQWGCLIYICDICDESKFECQENTKATPKSIEDADISWTFSCL